MNINNNNEQYPILEQGTVKNWKEKVKNIGRPTIFVGSSRESKPIAEKLKTCFPADEFEVDMWYDGVFGPTLSTSGTMSNMEWLKSFTDIYDFAIFIFVPEDSIVSSTRKNLESNQSHEAHVTRHNVVFEFGMFLGKVGAKRSFILFDSEVQKFVDLFFTDLKENLEDARNPISINEKFRLELHQYQGNYKGYIASGFKDPPYDSGSIETAIENIKTQIKINFESVDIGFLPAVSLAFGYYNNFIHFFVANVIVLRKGPPFPKEWFSQELTQAKLDDFYNLLREAETIKLKIVIPTSIEGTRQEKFIPDFESDHFTRIKFPGSYRAFTVLSGGKRVIAGKTELVIYDVPATLNSSIEAIEMMTSHTDIKQLLKEKELRNFKKSLEYKIKKGGNHPDTPNAGDVVSLISYEAFKEETRDYAPLVK